MPTIALARCSLLGVMAMTAACSDGSVGGTPSHPSQTTGGTAGGGKAGTSGAAGSVSGGSPGSAGSGGVPSSAGQGGTTTGGNGGTSSGGTTSSGGYTSLAGFGGAPEDKPGTVEVGVRNGCAFPIWIHGAGNGGTLQPDDSELQPMDIVWYDAPQTWSAARITAYGDGPRQGELDKVEMTFGVNGGGENLNYNVTYVDWLGLPVEIDSTGTGGDCKKVGCYVPQANVLADCPQGLLEGKRCLSGGSYCGNASHQSTAFCTQLSDEITKCASTKADCAGASGATTAQVYGCSGFFGGSPKWCAALNRHMLDAPDSTDIASYYQTEPYNTYSKWVHQVCPGIYAFPYDDYPSNAGESGFHSCTGAKELRITFCPSG